MVALKNTSRRLLAPIGWYGGKARMLHQIVPYIPFSHIYCEPFGGSGVVLCNLRKRPVEVYNDLDQRLVTLFRVLQDKHKRLELFNRCNYTLYSQAEYDKALDQLDTDECSEIDIAWATFVIFNQSFAASGRRGCWSHTKATNGDRATNVHKWRRKVGDIPRYFQRFVDVQVENKPAIEVIKRWDTDSTVFYLDPPYVPDTRTIADVYDYEMTHDEHKDLLDVLLSVKGGCVLSGYECQLYTILDRNGWNRRTFDVSSVASSCSRRTESPQQRLMARRVEVLWSNPRALKLLNKNGGG